MISLKTHRSQLVHSIWTTLYSSNVVDWYNTFMYPISFTCVPLQVSTVRVPPTPPSSSSYSGTSSSNPTSQMSSAIHIRLVPLQRRDGSIPLKIEFYWNLFSSSPVQILIAFELYINKKFAF